jgi:hypothetical protein
MRMRAGTPLKLVREPRNKHDLNAIAVYTSIFSIQLGHIPRSLAAELAPLMDLGVIDPKAVKAPVVGAVMVLTWEGDPHEQPESIRTALKARFSGLDI